MDSSIKLVASSKADAERMNERDAARERSKSRVEGWWFRRRMSFADD
jgi:hypothetical protein